MQKSDIFVVTDFDETAPQLGQSAEGKWMARSYWTKWEWLHSVPSADELAVAC